MVQVFAMFESHIATANACRAVGFSLPADGRVYSEHPCLRIISSLVCVDQIEKVMVSESGSALAVGYSASTGG